MGASTIRVAERVLEQSGERPDIDRGDIPEAWVVSTESVCPVLVGSCREVIDSGVIDHVRSSSACHNLRDRAEFQDALHPQRRDVEQIAVRDPFEPAWVQEPLPAERIHHTRGPGDRRRIHRVGPSGFDQGDLPDNVDPVRDQIEEESPHADGQDIETAPDRCIKRCGRRIGRKPKIVSNPVGQPLIRQRPSETDREERAPRFTPGGRRCRGCRHQQWAAVSRRPVAARGIQDRCHLDCGPWTDISLIEQVPEAERARPSWISGQSCPDH